MRNFLSSFTPPPGVTQPCTGAIRMAAVIIRKKIKAGDRLGGDTMVPPRRKSIGEVFGRKPRSEEAKQKFPAYVQTTG